MTTRRDDDDVLLELAVDRVTPEALDVVSIVLRAVDGGTLPAWDPGAHIDLILAPGLERQYSLCGPASDRASWRIGILREPRGRGGSARVHGLAEGDRVSARGPRNNFALQPGGRYLFIAGGIGITPLLPMIAEVERRQCSWRLLYGGRTAGSMAFTDELRRYGTSVSLWPQDEHGLLPLDAVVGSAPEDTTVYCCGPPPLISAVESICAKAPRKVLHVERFQPRDDVTNDGSTFQVVLARSGVTVDVGADETIVQALEKARIQVRTSCREGTCATCETEVLEGKPDHRDSVLSDAEREAGNTMMICCSRALSPRLVLDL